MPCLFFFKVPIEFLFHLFFFLALCIHFCLSFSCALSCIFSSPSSSSSTVLIFLYGKKNLTQKASKRATLKSLWGPCESPFPELHLAWSKPYWEAAKNFHSCCLQQGTCRHGETAQCLCYPTIAIVFVDFSKDTLWCPGCVSISLSLLDSCTNSCLVQLQHRRNLTVL